MVERKNWGASSLGPDCKTKKDRATDWPIAPKKNAVSRNSDKEYEERTGAAVRTYVEGFLL